MLALCGLRWISISICPRASEGIDRWPGPRSTPADHVRTPDQSCPSPGCDQLASAQQLSRIIVDRWFFAEPTVVLPMGNGPLLQKAFKAFEAFTHHRPQPRDPVLPEGGAVLGRRPEMKQRTSRLRPDFDVAEDVGNPCPTGGGDPVDSARRPPQSDEPEREPEIGRAGDPSRVPAIEPQHSHEVGGHEPKGRGQRSASPQQPVRLLLPSLPNDVGPDFGM